jgi:hypothetical protein
MIFSPVHGVQTGCGVSGGKAAEDWSWPPLYLPARSRMVELYLHSTIRLHSMVLNWLSTGSTSPCTFYPMRSLDFFPNLANSSSRTMTLGLTQPLTKMSARNLPGGKGLTTSLPSVSRLSRRYGSLDSFNFTFTDHNCSCQKLRPKCICPHIS